MKVLYALQKTGNGHIARAESIIPILKKYVDCDVLISGSNSQLKLKETPEYDLSGISLIYSKKGGVSYFETVKKNNYLKALKDFLFLDFSSYDLIINDFEPITAWNAERNQLPIVALSHQAALLFDETPKPDNYQFFEEKVLKYYAYTENKFGFHFQAYNKNIFTPVIRNSIRHLLPIKKEHYVVYLPSYPLQTILNVLKQIPIKWKIFHKEVQQNFEQNNCECFSVNQQNFMEYFASCKGVLCNSGFELPAESMFLEKKLFCIPMKNQYEQLYNLKALDCLEIPNSFDLNIEKLKNWVESEKLLSMEYPDQTEEIILKVLENKF